MWINFSDGFVSVVANRDDPNGLLVRARRREILETLFPNREIISTSNSDYKYRVFATRDEVSKLIAERVANIDYDNFKNSVTDKDLSHLYYDFWVRHARYQR